MQAKCLFLGTGASTGIPVIGCRCAVCSSPLSHNRRLRPSVLLKFANKLVLIDCGPDFRQQALINQIHHLDGLLLTHTHFDHIAGIDELRVYNFYQKRPLLCVLSEDSYRTLQRRYDYIFEPIVGDIVKSAQFQFQVLGADNGEAEITGVKFHYFHFMQQDMKVTGYRFGDFAYITDIHKYHDQIFEYLHGVQKLVISALSTKKSGAHFSLEDAIRFAQKVGAQHTWLTHIGHQMDHETLERELPPEIRMGYDGLEIEFRT